jgi:hypothetical protein
VTFWKVVWAIIAGLAIFVSLPYILFFLLLLAA